MRRYVAIEAYNKRQKQWDIKHSAQRNYPIRYILLVMMPVQMIAQQPALTTRRPNRPDEAVIELL